MLHHVVLKRNAYHQCYMASVIVTKYSERSIGMSSSQAAEEEVRVQRLLGNALTRCDTSATLAILKPSQWVQEVGAPTLPLF